MKYRFILFLAIILSIQQSAYSAKEKYPVSTIPDSLKEDAKAVVRRDLLEFELKSLTRCIRKETTAITIMDRSGDSYAYGYFYYDNERHIVNLTATIYSDDGEVVKRLSISDFKERSVDPFGTLYTDTRYYYLTGGSSNYPYTIEYDVTYSFDYSYNFPHWIPQNRYDMSVQQSSFIMKVPEEYEFDYKALNTQMEPKVDSEKGVKQYQWTVTNLKAIEGEPFSPSVIYQVPNVMTRPSDFAYDNYTGSFESWESYGKFVSTLNEGRNDLSEAAQGEILEIVSGIENTKEKIRILYEYMQNQTRYVSIQVGIGGIQPFPASMVENYGYGDCKALSNYMKNILEAAGIESYYSLIRAGKAQYYYDTTFVHDPFNHIILYVPVDDEDVWLECTSQTMPFGFLGDFTDDRYALVISEEGSYLKKTPRYGMNENSQACNAKIEVDSDGNARAKIQNHYTGLDYDSMLGVLNLRPEEQEDYLYDKKIDIPNFKINSFNYEDKPSERPQLDETLDLELISYASASGSRIFIPLNLMNRWDYIPPRDRDRRNPIAINQEFIESDSLVYSLPEGYSIEFCPEGDTIESKFGRMYYYTQVLDQKVLYVRIFEFYRNTYPKEDYDDFLRFCKDLNKADKQNLILVKK